MANIRYDRINEEVKKAIRFVPVSRLEQVLSHALLTPRQGRRAQTRTKQAVEPQKVPAGLVGEQGSQQATLRQ